MPPLSLEGWSHTRSQGCLEIVEVKNRSPFRKSHTTGQYQVSDTGPATFVSPSSACPACVLYCADLVCPGWYKHQQPGFALCVPGASHVDASAANGDAGSGCAISPTCQSLSHQGKECCLNASIIPLLDALCNLPQRTILQLSISLQR